MLRPALACSLLLAPVLATPWIDTGHMVVAAIAEKRLTPAAKAAVANLFQGDTSGKTNNFVTCSAWADDIKSQKDAHWHYINLHFRSDGRPTPNKPLEENVVWAIEKFAREVGDRTLPREQRRNALKYLVHFVGDVHQPLHAVARDTDEHPKGDRGGNEFKVVGRGLDPEPRSLHFLWDIAGGLFPTIERPLTATGTSMLSKLAQDIENLFPERVFPGASELDPKQWAAESLALAQSSLYNLEPNAQPTKLYLAYCQSLSAERAAVAGYRLARILNRVLR